VRERDLPGELHELDVNIFESVAEFHAPGLDRVIPVLSTAASYSRLWMGVGAGLAAVGGPRGRRAAVAGLAAIGVTSLLANAVVKPLAARRRPVSPVPEARRLVQPKSTSFPSGHTASAAAFSGVVGAQIPSLRAPLDALALSVAFSRVYTGVHYPGDVVAGWVLGRLIATAVSRAAPRIEAAVR
jgi:undecaprenyl-diphosphatase